MCKDLRKCNYFREKIEKKRNFLLKYFADIDGNVNVAKGVDEINKELDKKTTTRSKKKKEIENE